VRRSFGNHLRKHEHFNDYTTPWWVAREAGMAVTTADMVLAWQDTGEVCGG